MDQIVVVYNIRSPVVSPSLPTRPGGGRLKIPLDDPHGGDIHLAALEGVKPRRPEDDAAEHGDVPVHRVGLDGRGGGEEAKDEKGDEEGEGEGVDGGAGAAEGPAGGREGFAAEALGEDAADGEDVGGEEGGEGEGDDGVEGDGGAEVDQADDDAEEEGDDDGVEGDGEGGGDLWGVVRVRFGLCTTSEEAEESMRTFAKNGENGRPLSRAKDQICRDAVAISAMTAQINAMITMAVMMLVPT